ncbi:hypothetical protein ARTSIC4J27_2356 [Pseudarthrobacter siccitolerans]|uniref:Uncharacterized protein n=1 Tax=Pseudarthrobacter siccitolerans TaxID=861266 RepID=A0A024H310_9MICC|nr:hypothetical protein [Pseudarthrobacter siccitolerans]CCQ46393.1 hypothetical protein ARTSIC4J27_2356 [Pseudarthrobacter siccitolerans]
MAVTFECITRTNRKQSELFDLARSIDVHKSSLAKSREKAVAGVKLLLARYLQELIESRNQHLAGAVQLP